MVYENLLNLELLKRGLKYALEIIILHIKLAKWINQFDINDLCS